MDTGVASDAVAGSDQAATGAPGASRLSLLPLTALVVGSMIGGGVFNLPSDMSAHASPAAVIIGWCVTGLGMLMLAFVYQGLAVRKPELNSGPFAYAKAGFGPYIGFQSAWGYWISAWLGNVSYAVAIFSALAFFFPIFGAGNTVQAVIGASLALWAIHALVLKGVKQAAFVNVVTTCAKITPLLVFILLAVIGFNYDKFTLDFWGTGAHGTTNLGGLLGQVKSTMLVTLWVFIGIEGASVYSSRAAKRSDVGTATVVGFLGALAIYVLVSLLSTGILAQKQLAGLAVPSMAGVLQSLVGPWGAALISLGLIISVGGAFLSWTMLCAEIPMVAAKDGCFPRLFARESKAGSPVGALWVTNGLIQLFLIITLVSASTYKTLYEIASVAILPPYVFSGAYALKLAWSGESYEGDPAARRRGILVGGVATIYGLWLCYAAGLEYLLLAAILFAPGTLVYLRARREHGGPPLTAIERGIAIVLTIIGIVAVFVLLSGTGGT